MDIANIFATIVLSLIGGGFVTFIYEFRRDKRNDSEIKARDAALRHLFNAEIRMNVEAAKSIHKDHHWMTHTTWTSFYTTNSNVLTVFDITVAGKVMQFYQHIDMLREHDRNGEKELARLIAEQKFDAADLVRKGVSQDKKTQRDQMILLGDEILKATAD